MGFGMKRDIQQNEGDLNDKEYKVFACMYEVK